MQQTGQTSGWGGAGRERVQAVVETLATLNCDGENLAEVAHDARNMVTALGLYCDLLEEPGVLAAPFLHYGNELRLVAAASRRLVEKLVALDSRDTPGASRDPLRGGARPPASVGGGGGLSGSGSGPGSGTGDRTRQSGRWDLLPALPIENLAAELMANRNLLAALAGPSIALTVITEGGALAVKLTGEDLTRVLVNLVKNAAEAMPAGGTIQLSLREHRTASGTPESLLLAVEDSGPGISTEVLESIFTVGFTTQLASPRGSGGSAGWPAAHRGLGLSITRSIIEAGGGSIAATNRSAAGARFEIELPVRKR